MTATASVSTASAAGAKQPKQPKFADVAKMTQRELDLHDLRLEDILFLFTEEARPTYPKLKYRARFSQWTLRLVNILPLKPDKTSTDPIVKKIDADFEKKYGPENAAAERFRRMVRELTYSWQMFVVPDTGAADEYRIDLMFDKYRASNFGLGLLEAAILEACTRDNASLVLRYGFDPVWTPDGLAFQYSEPERHIHLIFYPDDAKARERREIKANEQAVEHGYYFKPLTNENLVGLLLYYRGKSLLLAGKTDKAIKDLKLSVARFPRCMESQLALGRTQLALGIKASNRDLLRHAAGTFQRVRERISSDDPDAYRFEGIAAVEQARLLMRVPDEDRTTAHQEDLDRVLAHARQRFDDLRKLKPKSNLVVFYLGYLDLVEGLGSDTPTGDSALNQAEKNFRAFLSASKSMRIEGRLREQAESFIRRIIIERHVRPLGHAQVTDVDRFNSVKMLVAIAERKEAKVPYYKTIPEMLEAVQPLINLLDHSNWRLRWHASKALSKISGKSFGLSSTRWSAWLRAQRAETKPVIAF